MTKRFALAAMAAALLTTTALAQSAPPASSTAPAMKPAQSTAAPAMIQTNAIGKWRTSKLIGLNVYNAANEKIGDINELITDSTGKIDTVVVGVGGFLGIGEHDVGIAFSQVKFVDGAGAHLVDLGDHHGRPAPARRPPRPRTTRRDEGLSGPRHGQHDQGSAQGDAGVQVRERHLVGLDDDDDPPGPRAGSGPRSGPLIRA